MNKSILYLSLLSNALFLGAGAGRSLGWFTSPNHAPVPASPMTVNPDHAPTPAPVRHQTPVRTEYIHTFTWASIESSDYRQYMQNLRSAGCPEETIADIITADIHKVFARERAQLQATLASGANNNAANVSSQLAQLTQKEYQTLESLLGQNWRFSLPETETELDYRFYGQSKETVRQILDLEEKYNLQSNAIHDQSPGLLTREDRVALCRLRQEKEERLTTLLGSQGYEDYLIKSSSSVQALSQNPGFRIKDEQEFRAIANAQIQWDRSLDEAEGTSDERNLQKEAEKTYLAAVYNVLGKDRFAEFERARDYRYQQIASLATRYGLPDGTAAQVFAINRYVESQLNQPNPQGASNVDTTILHQQYQAQIRQLLGEPAFDSYCQLLQRSSL